MCNKLPLRTTKKAVVAKLGVCGFYSKLFENKLMCLLCRPPVSSSNRSPRIQHHPEKIYKIQRISIPEHP